MAEKRERNRLYRKVIKDLKSWHKYFWTRIHERLTVSVSKIDIGEKPMVKIVIGQDGYKFWSVAVKSYIHYRKTLDPQENSIVRPVGGM